VSDASNCLAPRVVVVLRAFSRKATVRRVGGAPRIGAKGHVPSHGQNHVGEVRNVCDRMHHHMTVGDQLQKLLECDGHLTLNEGEHIPQKSAVGSKRIFSKGTTAPWGHLYGDHDGMNVNCRRRIKLVVGLVGTGAYDLNHDEPK
jgi:hypothetical protein